MTLIAQCCGHFYRTFSHRSCNNKVGFLLNVALSFTLGFWAERMTLFNLVIFNFTVSCHGPKPKPYNRYTWVGRYGSERNCWELDPWWRL